FAAEAAVLIEQFGQRLEALSRFRGNAQDRSSGVTVSNQPTDFIYDLGRHLIDAVNSDGVGFLQLLAEDVRGLRRKPGAFFIAQDAEAMARLKQNGVWRYLEAVAVQFLERLGHRGDEVGAAANRFGQDHIGPFAHRQAFDAAKQVVELAAKTGAGDFLDRETL